MNAVLEEHLIGHMFVALWMIGIRLHDRHTVDLSLQRFGLPRTEVTMNDQRSHAGAVSSLPRLIKAREFKGIVDQQSVFQGRMEKKRCTVKQRDDRRLVGRSFSKFSWLPLLLA
ncbi:hypothetical protein WJ13_11680 [Burkholderia seminalis]|nr:hypothetical protein WJ13_11680 [Burkholderia seminalis]